MKAWEKRDVFSLDLTTATESLLRTILPRDAMLCIRDTIHGPVSVCLSQVGVLSKRMDESGWFLAWQLPSTYPTLC